MQVLGFAEMMTIKMGELIDQPRHLRVQALEAGAQIRLDVTGRDWT